MTKAVRLTGLLLAVVLAFSAAAVKLPASAAAHLGILTPLQNSSRWGGYAHRYGGGTLQVTGCGIFSLVNAVGYVTGRRMNIDAVAAWAHGIGAYNPGNSANGTVRGLLYPRVQAQYGSAFGFKLNCNGGSGWWAGSGSSVLKRHLANHQNAAVCHVPGHFIALVDWNGTRYRVYDSAPSRSRPTGPTGDKWLTPAQLASGGLKLDWFCLLSPTASAPPEPAINTGSKGYYRTTAEGVTVRSGPALTCSTLATMPNGTVVYVYGITADKAWAKLYYNGVTGWSSMAYLSNSAPAPDPPIDTTKKGYYRTTAEGVTVRSGPALTYSTLATMPNGMVVYVYGVTTDKAWAKLYYNGVTGWSSTKYLSNSAPDPNPPIDTTKKGYYVTTDELPVRSGPALTYSTLATMPVGTKIYVYGVTADNCWAKLYYNGITGWSSMAYLTNNPPASQTEIDESKAGYYYVTAELPVHTGPGVSYSVQDTMPVGTKPYVYGITLDGCWAKLYYNDKAGWSSRAYLSNSEPTPEPEIDTSKAGYYIATADLPVYSGAKAAGSPLATVPVGTKIYVYGVTTDNAWAKLYYQPPTGGAVTGYASRADMSNSEPTPEPEIDTSKAGYYIATADLHVYSGAKATGSPLATVPVGTKIYVYGVTADSTWAKLYFQPPTGDPVTGYASRADMSNSEPKPVTAPQLRFSGGTEGASYALPYNTELTVSWDAVENATRYDYHATFYEGEWSATALQLVVDYSSTTGTSFTVPARASGKYIYVTVAAVGPSNTAVTQSVEVLLGQPAVYPEDLQYIPVNEINGDTNVCNSVILTGGGENFTAVYWDAFLCFANADGTYSVKAAYKCGEAKDVAVSGTDILFAIHADYANRGCTDAIAVGDTLSLHGIYLDANTIRGDGYILVNGGASVSVGNFAVTAPDEADYGATADVSWSASENAASYNYKVTNGGTTVAEGTGVTKRRFTIPAQSSGDRLTVSVTAIGAADSRTVTKSINLKPTVPADISSSQTGVQKLSGRNAFRGIAPPLDVDAVLALFEQDAQFLEIRGENGAAMYGTDPVGTGCTVNLVVNGNVILSYVLAVNGDINGDAAANSADYVCEKQILKGCLQVPAAGIIAADINGDGFISALDVAALKASIPNEN